jgi:hypothetical protein
MEKPVSMGISFRDQTGMMEKHLCTIACRKATENQHARLCCVTRCTTIDCYRGREDIEIF